MRIIATRPPRDPWRFLIHAFFAFIIGAAMGLGAYATSPFNGPTESWIPLALHVGIRAIVIGLVAGYYGDDFWQDLRKWWST